MSNTRNIGKTIETYVNNILNATSQTNMINLMRNILSKRFIFNDEMGKKRDFSVYLFNKQTYFKKNHPRVRVKGSGEIIITFGNIKHNLYLDPKNKIYKVTETIKGKQSGGIGYNFAVGLNPIAGQPVVKPYLNCCRPIYNCTLLNGCSRNQTGGRLNTAYYLDIAGNHFNVLPQYRQYEDPIC